MDFHPELLWFVAVRRRQMKRLEPLHTRGCNHTCRTEHTHMQGHDLFWGVGMRKKENFMLDVSVFFNAVVFVFQSHYQL